MCRWKRPSHSEAYDEKRHVLKPRRIRVARHETGALCDLYPQDVHRRMQPPGQAPGSENRRQVQITKLDRLLVSLEIPTFVKGEGDLSIKKDPGGPASGRGSSGAGGIEAFGRPRT
jgi:hypothetical protein